MMILSAVCLLLLGGIALGGWCWQEEALAVDFSRKNLAPCLQYPFGTDWMGRDMFVRTIAGLSLSIRLGAVTAGISSLIALALGLGAAVLGKAADSVIGGLIDLVLGIPHILLLVLISYGTGKKYRWPPASYSVSFSLFAILFCSFLQPSCFPLFFLLRPSGFIFLY